MATAVRTDEAWQTRAACRGPLASVFFPPSSPERSDTRVEREQRAKTICARCPVRQACLDFAVRTREAHGIWGGLTEVERHSLA